MIRPIFQTWAMGKIFFIEMDKKEKGMSWKKRLWYYPFKEWYRMYCRIVYLNGDWTKSVLWTNWNV